MTGSEICPLFRLSVKLYTHAVSSGTVTVSLSQLLNSVKLPTATDSNVAAHHGHQKMVAKKKIIATAMIIITLTIMYFTLFIFQSFFLFVFVDSTHCAQVALSYIIIAQTNKKSMPRHRLFVILKTLHQYSFQTLLSKACNKRSCNSAISRVHVV